MEVYPRFLFVFAEGTYPGEIVMNSVPFSLFQRACPGLDPGEIQRDLYLLPFCKPALVSLSPEKTKEERMGEGKHNNSHPHLRLSRQGRGKEKV